MQAFLASINKTKEDSKSLTDENENTAVLESDEDVGDGCPLVPQTNQNINNKENKDKNDNNDKNKHGDLANGKVKNIERKSSISNLGCDADSDEEDSMPGEDKEDKDDPGVVNLAFFIDDDEVSRGEGSTTSARSSPDQSPSHSPRLNFRSVYPLASRSLSWPFLLGYVYHIILIIFPNVLFFFVSF